MGMEMKTQGKIVSLLVMLCTAGCMMGPDFQRPVMEVPAEFRFSEEEAEAVVNLKWWELFDDPVLDSLVSAALKDNKDMRIRHSMR